MTTYLDLLIAAHASMVREMDECPRIDKKSTYYRHFAGASVTTLVAGTKYIHGLVAKAESFGHPPAKAAEKALGCLGLSGLLEEDYAKIYARLAELNKIITDCEKANG